MSLETVRKNLSGISGVPVTPYRQDGEPDTALLRQVVDRIAGAGIHNVIAAGNTGEFFSLTGDEVRQVHVTTIEAADRRSLVFAAVGRSLTEATRAGRAAAASGADAVLVHQPTDPFAAPSAQADYFISVAETAEVPVIAYVRSDMLRAPDLVRIARHPNVAGLKFASTNIALLSECMRDASGLPAVWVCGLAEGWAAPFYAVGARGFTSGLANIFPELSLAIHAALEAGDYETTSRLTAAIAPFEAMRANFHNGSNVTVVKEALELLGLRVGAVRLPGLSRLDDENRSRLAEIIDGWRRIEGIGKDSLQLDRGRRNGAEAGAAAPLSEQRQ